jgi:DNA polymerase V
MAIVDIKTLEDSSSIKIPIFVSNISAGFPSPADDYIEDVIDLNKHLVEHPSAIFSLE